MPNNCQGGVAQWTSYPSRGTEDPGSNPARLDGIKGKHSNAVVYNSLYIYALFVSFKR
jgi:hypothetical protein